MLRRNKFLIGGLIVFAAIGYMVFAGLQSSSTYYFTVSEFRQQETSINGKTIRVNGQAIPGSIEHDIPGRTLSFTITEGGQSLPVVYHGTVPDTFKAGAIVVVEGQVNSDGILKAQIIMPKCPSKYVPKE